MHLIYFPWMHSDAAPEAAGLGVRFLDPGLGDTRQPEYSFVPEGLPLDRRRASRYVQEALSFGERFQDHKELEYLRAAGLEDFFSGTSSALSDELERRLKDQERGGEDPDRDLRERGQMVLLLSWELEKKLLEAHSGEREYSEMVSELRENLGMQDVEGLDPLDFGDTGGIPEKFDSSRWSGLMPWFLLFLPEDGVLYIEDASIRTEVVENGMETIPLSEATGYEDLKRFARERGVSGDLGFGVGWRLALGSRSDPDMPWLDREYAVFLRRS